MRRVMRHAASFVDQTVRFVRDSRQVCMHPGNAEKHDGKARKDGNQSSGHLNGSWHGAAGEENLIRGVQPGSNEQRLASHA